MNVQEAAKRLGKSEPTIRRWIREGILEAQKIEGIYNISESAVSERSASVQITEDERSGEVAAMRAHIESLERELSEKGQQIAKLQGEVSQASERSDTIILQLTRQLDQSQRLLEYHREPFWRRWFKRKQGEDSG